MLEFFAVILVAGAAFGLCFLVDKGFNKIFRSKPQHMSGLSVRLSKRFGSIGLILAVLGVAAIFAGLDGTWIMIVGGAVIFLVGLGLVVYYMSFGVFYDDDGFVLTTFGRKSTTYSYADIKAQQLFASSGSTVIELYLTDGRTVQLQSTMTGVYPFLDKAFEGWLLRKGLTKEQCPFYDPDNSCWFPTPED